MICGHSCCLRLSLTIWWDKVFGNTCARLKKMRSLAHLSFKEWANKLICILSLLIFISDSPYWYVRQSLKAPFVFLKMLFEIYITFLFFVYRNILVVIKKKALAAQTCLHTIIKKIQNVNNRQLLARFNYKARSPYGLKAQLTIIRGEYVSAESPNSTRSSARMSSTIQCL